MIDFFWPSSIFIWFVNADLFSSIFYKRLFALFTKWVVCRLVNEGLLTVSIDLLLLFELEIMLLLIDV